MQQKIDMQLLRRYAREQSEEAFATLVERYVNLVYSAAFRHVGNTFHAQEITQVVFMVLATKSKQLSRKTVLSGWLYQTARLTSLNFMRSEAQRVKREQEVYVRSTSDDSDVREWQKIASILDDAMAGLGDKDRDAIVLRFFNGQNLSEVGAAMGISEEAAKKRVSRAVDKLRAFFAKRGTVFSAGALASVISINAVQAAPAGLGGLTVKTIFHGTAVKASTLALVKGAVTGTAWTKTTIAVGLGLAVLVVCQQALNVSQGRQLASVRNELATQQLQLAVQEAAIEKAGAENLALQDEKRAAPAKLAELLARQQAKFEAVADVNATVHSNDGTAGVPESGVNKLLNDPATKESMHRLHMQSVHKFYGPFFQEMKFTPEQTDKFVELVSSGWMLTLERWAALSRDEASKEEMLKAQEEIYRTSLEQFKALLGEDGFAKYEAYNEELPARYNVKSFGDLLGADQLSADQSTRLIQIIKAEPPQFTGAITGYVDDSFVGSADGIDKYMQQVADAYQRVRNQASSFLDADQLAAWDRFQANVLIQARVQGTSVMQKH